MLARARIVGLGPLLSILAASCGPAPEGKAPAPSVGARASLALVDDTPPPAASVTPIVAKPMTLPTAWVPRRPILPPPAPPPPPSAGSVDESGDETALADILIGAPAPSAESGKPMPLDATKARGGVRMVIDSPYEIFSKTGTYIHLAAWTPTFAPASNARVFVDGLLRGRTSPEGTLVFRDVPSPSGSGGSHVLRVVNGTGAGAIFGEASYHAYSRTQSFERANLYVYTDRGLFSPGETVHVRAFAWRLRGDYRPYSDTSINVLFGKDGKVLTGGRVKTDTFGVASIDLPLPLTTATGTYELAVEHLGEKATARVQVKPFVAPVTRIDHDLPRFLTRDANDISFEIKLAAATGEAFKEGTLTWKALDPRGTVVGTETRNVRGGGPHKFTVDRSKLALMRNAFSEGQMAAIVVEVVDGPTGRRDELRRDLLIANAPYRLVVETDRTEHVPGETVKIVIHATDLEQAPVSGQEIALRITDSTGRELGKPIVKTDATGLAQTTATMPKSELSIDASLVKTPSVHGYGYVYESEPRAMFADVPVPSVKEREATPVEVKFPSQYVPAEKVVHADVVDSSGALIYSFLLPIKAEAGGFVAKGTFPAPSWGSMLMTFFALGAQKGRAGNPAQIGLLTDGANLPVAASRPITVTLKAPALAKPGESIAVDVSLVGPPQEKLKGRGARPFELGASISEDALLSLIDPLEHAPADVLYNPERKVMASTGAQILTWPVVQKTWGTWNYDIALPPFGFRPGGAAPAGGAPGLPGDAFGYGGIGLSGTGEGGGGAGDAIGLGKVGGAAKGAGGGAKPKVTGGAKSDGDDKPSEAPPPPPTSPKKPAPPALTPAPTATAMADAESKAAPSTATGATKHKVAPDDVTISAGPIAPRTRAESEVELPSTTISIRTDFAPTSLWMPHLPVPLESGGLARIMAKLPDAITTQRLTVVASDDRGAIGIGRASIRVDQDLSVRSDLPAMLTQGDELEVSVAVRNTREAGVTGNVALTAQSGLQLVGPASAPLTVSGKGSAAAHFRVRALSPGQQHYTVAFMETRAPGAPSTTPLRDDQEHRTVHVRPRGAPVPSSLASTLTAGMPLTFEVERRESDTWVEADLSIAFPSAIPMIEGLDDLVSEESYVGVDPDASRLLAAIAIEGYLMRTHGSRASLDRVHGALSRGAAELVTMQQPDGGFGWRWDTWAATHGLGNGSSPFVTSHALLALAKLRDTDVAVPDAAVASARSYLLRALDPQSKGEASDLDVSAVAFWEGEGPKKQRAATMSAFHAIAASERGQPVWGIERKRVDALADKAVATIRGGPGSEDPLTISEATMGLYLHALATSQLAKFGDDIEQGAKALLASYRHGYWEPSWFHAWGGRVEATRGAIELLTTIAPGAYDTELHDAASFLMATRPSWGAWHNAWGTAAAIEGLALLDPTPPERTNASVQITVDGRTVATAKIDPSDPFASAAALRSIDLSPYLAVGRHEVRLAYDGTLSVPASISLRRWSNVPRLGVLGLQIERALVAEATVGGRANEQVQITTKLAHPELVVSVPLSPGLSPDEDALQAMVKSQQIASYRIEGALVLSLHDVKAGTLKLDVPMRASRKGSFSVAAVRAWAPRSADEAWSGAATLAVK